MVKLTFLNEISFSCLRMTCHEYMKLYKEKLSHKKVSEKVEKKIEQYEEILDVLNITIWRKQAEIEVRLQLCQ